MKALVWSLVALLVVFHQDVWLWGDDTLVLGFIPIGLFYHACLSVAASAVWLLAVNVAWPGDDVDDKLPASERPVPREKVNPRFAAGGDVQGAPA